MKRFWEGLMEWKTAAALLFTGSVILYVAVTILLGKDTISVSIILSDLTISAVGTFLQLLAFSSYIIKKMHYTLRMIIFVVPFFALLAANAYFFSWFPMESGYWLSFAVIFLIVFVLLTIGFEIYYRAMGRKYDGLLGQYRKQKEMGAE